MPNTLVEPMNRRISLAVPTPSYTASAAVIVQGMSRDGKTFYGRRASDNTVMLSTDDGASWPTAAHTFTDTITGVLEMGNGEVIVVTDTGTSTGSLWVSSGWAADPTTATWTKTLTTVTSAGNHNYFEVAFGSVSVDPLGSGIVTATEYGKQTAGLADPENAAVHSWVSQDYGVTWVSLVDLLTLVTTGSRHLHGAAYDPWWDRLWVTYGDAGSSAFLEIWYSDDWRNALTGGTPTWTRITQAQVAAPATVGGYQSLQIMPMPSCLLFTPDDQPNFAGWRIARRGYRALGRMAALNVGNQAISPTVIGRFASRNGAGGALISIAAGAGIATLFYTPDGYRFWPVAADTGLDATAMNRVFGPSARGVILGGAGTSSFSITINTPEDLPPRRGGVASVADGGTIAHGLGFIPAGYSLTPTAAGHIAAVTAVDATNLTVSLTVASTGAAVSVAENVAWSAGSQ